jgi:hypothetical protein
MKNLDLVLRAVIFFLFPVPFLLAMALAHGEDWTAYIAYAAIAILVVAAVTVGWRAGHGGE